MPVSNFRGTAFVFFSIFWLLCSICVQPVYSGSGRYRSHPLSAVVSMQTSNFSKKVALKGLTEIEKSKISLPSRWRFYLAATFALELKNYKRYRKYMVLLKTEDRVLHRLLAVTHRILDLIRRGKTQDSPKPLSRELHEICIKLKYSGTFFPIARYSRREVDLCMQFLGKAAGLAFRWRHSNEVLIAFVGALRSSSQYRLVVLICQEIFDTYGTTTSFGRKAVKILRELVEIFGPRSRYIELMHKLGKKPRTEEEMWQSGIRL